MTGAGTLTTFLCTAVRMSGRSTDIAQQQPAAASSSQQQQPAAASSSSRWSWAVSVFASRALALAVFNADCSCTVNTCSHTAVHIYTKEKYWVPVFFWLCISILTLGVGTGRQAGRQVGKSYVLLLLLPLLLLPLLLLAVLHTSTAVEGSCVTINDVSGRILQGRGRAVPFCGLLGKHFLLPTSYWDQGRYGCRPNPTQPAASLTPTPTRTQSRPGTRLRRL